MPAVPLGNLSLHGSFKRPAKLVHSLRYILGVAAKSATNLSSASRYTIVGDYNILSCIGVLLGSCCPPAIVRGVVGIIIDAVNAVKTAWAPPHIGQKSSVSFSPFVNREPAGAHTDTSAGIVRMRFASGSQRTPSLKLGLGRIRVLFAEAGFSKATPATAGAFKGFEASSNDNAAHAAKFYPSAVYNRQDYGQKPIDWLQGTRFHKHSNAMDGIGMQA